MNGTIITQFIFLGFSCSRTVGLIFFAVVLAIYITILLGNLLIMVTVRSDPHLYQSPMYFFLAHLSLIDMSLGSVATPKLVTDLLNGGGIISFWGCIVQIFAFHFLSCVEEFLLSLMAYDRYVAICHPLKYSTIMGRQRCINLIFICWGTGIIHGIIQAVLTAQLPFCGSNVLDNFWCDTPQVVKLACSDIYVVEMLMVVTDSVIVLPCLLTLLASYVTILATLTGRFGKGGKKALSTCSSHLIVVCLYYGPVLFVYVKPPSGSQIEKMFAVFYVAVTPALNPLIYSLRNQEMKTAMKKLKSKCKLLLQLLRD